MTVAKNPSPIRVETGQGDIRTIQWGRTWEQFKHLQKGFENTRGVRLFYYNGTIEILMPGEAHQLFKSIIGFLVETFLFNREIEFKPTGSMTQEKEGIASTEADESYEIEGFKLSIEVNFTSSDVSKLKRYQALDVHEVWIWEDGVLAVYHLQSGEYKKVDRSLIPALSAIDLKLMSECILIGETSRIKAAKKLLESSRSL
ncbi:Uma2 family endonuclease [Kovacikia minuta CCNUW1]|uniref:Uma2 family endonuclease n=1 Tax=Kovacikia minuta TaxID=2931930 RepID=UPI001CCF152D|nr:Uma2 family endonuclease [Kovacikia minuta]UBF25494.1 Uma2 family endonuclease [Kovacikia minuta CCNUW1]